MPISIIANKYKYRCTRSVKSNK